MNDSQPYDSAGAANLDCFDRYYDKPFWWFWLRYDTQVKRKTCLYLLRKAGRPRVGQRVLEIGFGSGATLLSFDRSCEIYGTEISRSALQLATRRARRKGFGRFRFEQAAGSTLPFVDRSMDIVIASHVLEHVQDDEGLLRQMLRVMSPDALAVILVPINEKYDDPKHVRRYTSASFAALAGGCGFEVVLELENELLFHLVDKFYFERYNKRWPILGPMIVAAFNIPTALLPYPAYRAIDRVMGVLGLKPRQVGFVLTPATRRDLGAAR